MKILIHRILFGVIVGVMLVSPALGESVNNTLYAKVLENYLKDGLVDYKGLQQDRMELDAYLDMMGNVDTMSLTREGRLAFYINLYNAATLQLIINNYPVDSIKDIGSIFSSPWSKRVVALNGEKVTLDNIEHDIIRPRFKEPRIHFALNCTAMSCPPLLHVPYEESELEEQLEMVTKRFLNDGENNYLDGKTLYVSKIFSWFSEDFPDEFVEWFLPFAEGELRQQLETLRADGTKIKVKYLKYDWSLNRQPE